MFAQRKIEKVFLLFPPVRLPAETMKVVIPPLGVSYIAAMIRNETSVEIMDAPAESDYEEEMENRFSWYGAPLSEIRARIERAKPDIVGLTCIFSSVFPVIRKVCQEIKKIDPSILTIVGGTYPSFMPEYCLSEPSLDFICLGEGEATMLNLIRHLREGKPLSDLDGFAYKDNGKVMVNPKTKWIEDLDTIPFPARDLLPMELYSRIGVPHSLSMTSKKHISIITSRGCPAKCVYCSSSAFWGRRYRFRSPKNVADEIGELIERWGIKELNFEDDNLTANRERAKKIFREIIDRGYKIRFNFPNGVALWTLDQELIDLMEKAGCYEMTLAYESGCQKVLRDIVKKPINLEQASEITAYIRKKKIRTDAFYIIGFPGETRDQIQETFRFARKMKTDLAYFFIANPLPGSEMYEMAKKAGMLKEDFNFENLSYSNSPYNEKFFKKGELEKLAGREFIKYSLLSFLRKPHILLKRFILDLLIKRPRYTLGILVRIWRRNFK